MVKGAHTHQRGGCGRKEKERGMEEEEKEGRVEGRKKENEREKEKERKEWKHRTKLFLSFYNSYNRFKYTCVLILVPFMLPRIF